jgi:hydrogenase expression/formation protein HypE
MRFGKLNSDELKDMLGAFSNKRPEVIQGSAVGSDCAVIKSDEFILLTTDPITAATLDGARLAIIVSVNDIAAGGGEPFACLVTVIAPPDKTAADIKAVMSELSAEAAKHNVDIIGGHTEFSDAVNRILISCTMLGKANELPFSRPQAGDGIVMTKSAGIEGTYILVTENKEKFSATEIAEAEGLYDKLCVAHEGAVALRCGIRLMHDITEGGIIGALAEICPEGLGAELHIKDVPLLDITKRACEVFGVNPYKLLSSGSMLIVTENPAQLVETLRAAGIEAVNVGRITESGNAVAVYEDGRAEELRVCSDEVYIKHSCI